MERQFGFLPYKVAYSLRSSKSVPRYILERNFSIFVPGDTYRNMSSNIVNIVENWNLR